MPKNLPLYSYNRALNRIQSYSYRFMSPLNLIILKLYIELAQ